jgi:hypothetical protein
MKQAFEQTRDDLAAVGDLGARVLVAHTTGVGGMYDESPSGETTLRLGFAHAARDEFLRNKHHEAVNLTKNYAQRGVLMLVTAAAIGIDEVRMRERIPLHGGIVKALRDAPHELYRGARERKQFVQVFKPATLTHFPSSRAARGEGQGEGRPLNFKRAEDLLPSWLIRSGENGFFSVANADALYRVMKVASVSELGHVLATTSCSATIRTSVVRRRHLLLHRDRQRAPGVRFSLPARAARRATERPRSDGAGTSEARSIRPSSTLSVS